MTGIKLELIIELIVVLAAPIIYQYYLWKKGRTTPERMRADAKIFIPLYILVFAGIVAWIMS